MARRSPSDASGAGGRLAGRRTGGVNMRTAHCRPAQSPASSEATGLRRPGTFRALLRLVRVEYCALGAAGVAAGAFVNGTVEPTAAVVAAALSVFFVAAGCYAFDDYFDLSVDRANRRLDRPLVNGTQERRQAIAVGAASLLLAAIAALLAAPGVLAIVAAGGGAALVYNRWLQRSFQVKNLLLAGAFPAPLLAGGLASGNPLSPQLAWCAGVAYLAGLGFEVMIDIADVDGDRACDAHTLSTRYGTAFASRAAAAALLGAAALLFLPVVPGLGLTPADSVPYLILAAAAAAAAAHVSRSLLSNRAPAHIFVLKRRFFLTLLLGLLAFVVGAAL